MGEDHKKRFQNVTHDTVLTLTLVAVFFCINGIFQLKMNRPKMLNVFILHSISIRDNWHPFPNVNVGE